MRKKKILVVDDDIQGVMVQMVLKSRNYDVITASNGIEGLEEAKKEKPDLILLDVNMPAMNGHEALSKLKSMDETNTIPVIMLTAQGQNEDVEKAHKLGADDYIVKPFNPTTLLEKIGQALK